MAESQPSPPSPKFTIDRRFIVNVPFKSRSGFTTHVPIMGAEGYIDVAHQIGLQYCRTITMERWIEDKGDIDKETRWAFAQVEVSVGGIIATGTATANTRDKMVKGPGMEVQVAETRAIKRALATACNITEREINPDMKEPTRDMTETPRFKRGDDEEDEEEEPKIPEEATVPPPDAAPQFDFPGASL